jgi:heme oxygenase
MLLDQLKAHTRTAHAELERLNGLPETLADYVAQLENHFGFIAAWEQALARALPADDVLRAGRTKRAWLEADLAFFGQSPAQIAALPLCPDFVPPEPDRPTLLGIAYVVEGSTLGGQFISRHLEQALGLKGGGGNRYYRSYGAEVGPRWQAFRGELLRASSPANDPIILRAAEQTFVTLHRWFSSRKPLAA